jgi:glycosyltransferase involved in cell wall biosynthesis
MPRIVTVYSAERSANRLTEMANIRWHRMSVALARRGYDVDLATAEHKWRLRQPTVQMEERLRRVPLSRVRWADYDVVKTLFHAGFETLERYGGSGHPFIISKLGSVVGPRDLDGIYFYGTQRERLFATQERIAGTSRFVTVLSGPARALWQQCFHPANNVLLVPGAVDREIPARGPDPYPAGTLRVLFAGNFYSLSRGSQPDAHRALAARLNELGRLLAERNARLYVLGPGEATSLDSRWVAYLGTAEYQAAWNYLQHADVGVVVAAGSFNHNNESTKMYHYLRVGLPVVSEAGFPNDDVVRTSGLGLVVPSGDMQLLAEAVVEAASRSWDRAFGVRFILEHHTWDARAELYDRVIRAAL